MEYTVLILNPAADDLETIKSYLEQFSGDAPERILRKLTQQMKGLRILPNRFPQYLKNPAFRRMVVEDYLVFYKVFEDINMVKIHHVLHHSRNIEKLIGN